MTPSELKFNSRELIFNNMPKIILVGLVYIVISTLISELQIRLPAPINIYQQLRTGMITVEQFSSSIRTSGLFLSFVLGIMLPTLSIGYKNYCLKTIRKQEGDYSDLLAGFGIFIKVILISLVTTVLIAFWSLLFIFPGIIAYYKYRQAYYILLDDPSKGVFHCINESKMLMSGKKIELFLIDISFASWYLLNVLILSFVIPVFPIVSIWLTPYYGLSQAAYYDFIIKEVAV